MKKNKIKNFTLNFRPQHPRWTCIFDTYVIFFIPCRHIQQVFLFIDKLKLNNCKYIVKNMFINQKFF